MARKCLKVADLLVFFASLQSVVAIADPAPLAHSQVPEKVPVRLSQWEITVAAVGARESIRPVRIFSDGRVACDEVWDGATSAPKLRIHQGALGDRDRDVVFAAARSAFNRVSLSDSLGFTFDAAMYKIGLSSGSRAMRVVLDEGVPAKLNFDAPLASGLGVTNRIIRKYGDGREFNPNRLRRGRLLTGSQPIPLRGSHAAVPLVGADWSRVYVKMILPDCLAQLTVYNPNVNQGVMYGRDEQSRNDMEISIVKGSPKNPPKPQSVAISVDDRKQFFADIAMIVNQFELHDPRDEEGTGNRRCVVGIAGASSEMEVEFKINDALPEDWRTRISRMLDLGHRKDESVPTLRDLTGNNPPAQAVP